MDISYKDFKFLNMYLDMVYLFKCIINKADSNTSIKVPVQETSDGNAINGTSLKVTKCRTRRTVSLINSYYIKASNVYGTRFLVPLETPPNLVLHTNSL